MNFTNIQVYNKDEKLSKSDILEKLKAFNDSRNLASLDIKNENKIDVKFDDMCSFFTCFDTGYKFKDLKNNKSYIRKLAKLFTLPVISVSYINDESIVIEQYNFNKRIYDYIVISKNFESLKKLGYERENVIYNEDIWNYFVGKNDISKIKEIIMEKSRYDDMKIMLIDILKLYGIKEENILYTGKE